MDIPNSGVSRNLDNESKYTAGPKSSHSKGKNDTEALSYEEPVQQTKSLPCDADMEQPLYEHIDVDVSHHKFLRTHIFIELLILL